MRKYVVTKIVIFEMPVDAESEEDAEHAALTTQEFKFVDEEYSVKEVGD